MNRYPVLIAALASVVVALSSPIEAHAATKKKPPVDTSDDASAPAKNTDASETPSAEKSTEKTDKDTPDSKARTEHAPAATVEPEKIAEFAAQPPHVQQLIRDAIDLTRQNLTYTFGSSDPASGGMDCSGTIYYLLRAHNLGDVPRDSSGQYLWARKTGMFFPVLSKSADSVEFKELQPGDLMFWTGTYQTGRDVPISHVMLYLGREKGTGKRIMFGASDGRSYNGIQRWGVSVFDFKMPKVDAPSKADAQSKADPTIPEKAKADFVGFARIPGLRSPGDQPVAASAEVAEKKDASAAAPDATPSKDATPKPHKKKKPPASD